MNVLTHKRNEASREREGQRTEARYSVTVTLDHVGIDMTSHLSCSDHPCQRRSRHQPSSVEMADGSFESYFNTLPCLSRLQGSPALPKMILRHRDSQLAFVIAKKIMRKKSTKGRAFEVRHPAL